MITCCPRCRKNSPRRTGPPGESATIACSKIPFTNGSRNRVLRPTRRVRWSRNLSHASSKLDRVACPRFVEDAWGRFRSWRSAKKGLRGEVGYRPLMAQEGDMRDQEIRAALDRHWAASDANDFEAEHSIYREDAVLEYPQSGERIRGRRNIQITRAKQPSKK